MIFIGLLFYVIALTISCLGYYEIGFTYATAYFILAIGFMICGTIFICFGNMNSKLNLKKNVKEK